MARTESAILVTAQMYRHFAIITLAVTGCLAMFASGENREALELRMARNKQQAEFQQAEMKRAKQVKSGNIAPNFKDNRKSKGSFATDSVTSVESAPVTMVRSGSARFSDAQTVVGERLVIVDEGQPLGPGEMPDAPPPGMTMEEYRQMKLGAKKKKKAENNNPSKADIDAFMAASAARSQTRED